jgi:hypothetical protein
MGTGASLYREQNHASYTPNEYFIASMEDLDPELYFMDYVETVYGIRPTNLCVSYMFSNDSTSEPNSLYRITPTTTNGQMYTAFQNFFY